ncbi:MAG: LON peptidase substrate-binding domain-containing protein, partial [Chromatiales bacterium]
MNDQEQSDIEVITSNQLARADEVLPGIIHLLPVAARPFFPGQAVPLLMHAEAWTPTIDAIAKSPHDLVGVVLTENDKSELATPGDMYRIGTVGRIHRAQMVDGKLQILIECLQRFRIEKFHTDRPPFTASVSYIKEFSGRPDDDIKAYAMAIINTIKELLPLNPLYAEELRMFLDRFGPDDPSHLADFAASLTTADKEVLQDVLETVELLPRMEKVLNVINNELQLVKSQQTIRKRVEERMEKQQREFFLKEQLREIQKELGLEKDDRTAELDTFRERIGDLELSEQAAKRVEEEMNKLAILEVGSPEYALTRNYIDWITLLPWGRES